MLGLSFDSARMVTSCGPRENHNTREPNPMLAGFTAHFVGGHHHQIRRTSALALTVVKVANGLERQSPLAAISVGMFARIERDLSRVGNRWRDAKRLPPRAGMRHEGYTHPANILTHTQ